MPIARTAAYFQAVIRARAKIHMGDRFKLGTQFPAEGFVQRAIEAHFLKRGYARDDAGHADLVCTHPETGEKWRVEAKGLLLR